MEERFIIFPDLNQSMDACLIRIDPKWQLVIATWPTHSAKARWAIDELATGLLQLYRLSPKRLLLIEHFSAATNLRPGGDLYYLVTFTWDDQQAKMPVRQYLSVSCVNQLLSVLTQNY